MRERDFFRNSARECRELAQRASSDKVRLQLLLWAREFELLADDTAAVAPESASPSIRAVFERAFGVPQPHLEPAD